MIKSYKEWINEEQLVPTASDASKNWGVKGKFQSDKEDDRKHIINPDSKILKDDKKILDDIVSKIDIHINGISDIEKYLEEYNKVNNTSLSAIILKLKAFKEAITIELNHNK